MAPFAEPTESAREVPAISLNDQRWVRPSGRPSTELRITDEPVPVEIVPEPAAFPELSCRVPPVRLTEERLLDPLRTSVPSPDFVSAPPPEMEPSNWRVAPFTVRVRSPIIVMLLEAKLRLLEPRNPKSPLQVSAGFPRIMRGEPLSR